MNDKDKNKKDASYDLMQDTQYLLMDLDESTGETYSLEEILAEFSDSAAAPEKEAEKAAAAEAAADPMPSVPEPLHPNVIAFPGMLPVIEDENSDDTKVLIDMREYEEESSPEELFGLAQGSGGGEPEPELTRQESEQTEEEPPAPKPLTMEDIVASTVDAVKAEQEQTQDLQRRRMNKKRKKQEKKHRRSEAELPPEEEPEQSPREAAAFHRLRWRQCRAALFFAVPVLLMLWAPWVLAEIGVAVPYFSESLRNAAVCLLAAQGLLCVLCAPVFRAALEELQDRFCTAYTYTALTAAAALLDAATLPVLPGRTAPVPLSSVASAALVFSLWGLKSYHRGMWEMMRTAAVGKPSCVADCCAAGIARGIGSGEGFVRRANMESTASQWQRILLPVLTAASVVFAALSTLGQGKGQDFFWCWSAVLCASCSLVCPMTYCVPLGRVAGRLVHSGTAVAGQSGAALLSSESRIVVTDTDLFPRKSVSLVGIKLYGEERVQAVSYAAALALQGGGCMGRLFDEICQQEHIACPHPEHFHVHDDNGLSGMIRGETVLLGTPIFMRHRGVRLPSTFSSKTAVCLAVDGELTAIFGLKYTAAASVETAMRALRRNGLQLVLATRDGNVTPKMIRKIFGRDGKAALPEISDRLALSDPRREAGTSAGLLYRDGLLPFVEMVSLSRRLCQMVRVGNLLAILGSVSGALLGFYLTFVGRSDIFSPVMLMVYLLLWTLPMLPLLVSVDRM